MSELSLNDIAGAGTRAPRGVPRRWLAGALLLVGAVVVAACVLPIGPPPEVQYELQNVPCGTTGWELQNLTQYPMRIDFIGEGTTTDPADITSDLGTIPAHQTAHLQNPDRVPFRIWYTLVGGPAPTASSSSPTTVIGTAIAGARLSGAPYVPASGPPAVASGVIVQAKFACVGTAIID
jgi:hypothetical protein